MKKRGSFSFKSDIGRVRGVNEDQVMVMANDHHDVLMVVCDGMGGHSRGDIASLIAIETMAKAFKQVSGFFTIITARLWLTKQIREANQAILKTAKNSPSLKEMGTTLVAVLIVGKEMVIANVGDSRAYMLKESLTALTQDQTYVNYLFKIGRINAEQVKTHPQRHVLLNALGLNKELNIEVETKPYRHETLLLCSDGLYNNTKEEQIQAILQTKDSVDQKVESLINLANHNGGTDNIAVALWESET